MMSSDTTAEAGSRIAAVIVAAGRGERAGDPEQGPKQYRRIGGKAIIARTLDLFIKHPRISPIIVVIHEDDRTLFGEAVDAMPLEKLHVVTGGADRQHSVLNGLEALAEDAPDHVLIHDGVRPFAEKSLLDRVINALDAGSGVITAVPVTDTLKQTGEAGIITDTISREKLFSAQTPQAFPYAAILAAHRSAAKAGITGLTDDAAVAQRAGMDVRTVAGSPDNIKITWSRDIAMANQMLGHAPFPDVRTGNGYDVHRFTDGDAVVLCGVSIPHDRKLDGHSDADVGLHALTDALLATIGAGDIGTHFPPSDPQWKGAASHIFVEHAASLVRAKGGRIANADITIIAEAPKVGPHRAAMTAALAAMLGIAPERISIKATTNEKMGFVGRAEGIAAIATASVIYPGEVPA